MWRALASEICPSAKSKITLRVFLAILVVGATIGSVRSQCPAFARVEILVPINVLLGMLVSGEEDNVCKRKSLLFFGLYLTREYVHPCPIFWAGWLSRRQESISSLCAVIGEYIANIASKVMVGNFMVFNELWKDGKWRGFDKFVGKIQTNKLFGVVLLLRFGLRRRCLRVSRRKWTRAYIPYKFPTICQFDAYAQISWKQSVSFDSYCTWHLEFCTDNAMKPSIITFL